MKKNNFIFGFLLFAGLLFSVVSCSSDDNVVKIDEKGNDVFTNDEDNITFCLYNKDMQKTVSFKEGENIIFDLTIYNNTDATWTIKRDFNGGDLVLDENFFCVYRENGERIGVPWSGMFCEESNQQEWSYSPHSVLHLKCSWYMDFSIATTHPLCKGADAGEDWLKLSKGSYYTKFTISYNTSIGQSTPVMKKQEFLIHFKIK